MLAPNPVEPEGYAESDVVVGLPPRGNERLESKPAFSGSRLW